ncbi:hypothetical protein Tsubulata_029795 [Turnera subulata]|uniref:Uncharacterized protein n=1 Tax=Turnera subulata TaxID=218843 RepID=A0A9Q0FBJ1_9ROSI|nr:hypothetical protein Tsubulata_029795 [Turnera subulata]
MNALVSSPAPVVDALVFDYVTFGIFTIVNNLWTWVAVITAAVSFWRIRAVAVAFSVKSKPITPPQACIDSSLQSFDTVPSTSAPSSRTAAVTATTTALSGFEEKGMTKGKFVVYYREEEEEEERENDGNGDDEECYGNGDDNRVQLLGCGEWWESWERVLTTRMGNAGWYSYQDLTVINGNVVRLWDGVRREKYSSSGCVMW